MGGLHKYSFTITPKTLGGLIDIGAGVTKQSTLGIGWTCS
jgi:hypothetical protein